MSEPDYPTCPYCGVPVRVAGSCRIHVELERRDELRGMMRGPITDRELGIVPGCPEGEAVDRGDE